MNKNILHRLFTVLLCLAAVPSGCQTSLPFFPTATPTITASPTLTKTATPAPTLASTKAPTASPTPEVPLGGSEVAYLFDFSNIPMPEEVKALLTPSSPDTWKQTGLYFTDGTPYPWGETVIEKIGPQYFLDVLSLVRGVVEIPDPRPDAAGGTILYVVLETPARGGSNFIILSMLDNKYETHFPFRLFRLPDGKIPVDWAQSSWEHPKRTDVITTDVSYKGIYSGRQMADMFKQYIGQPVMTAYQPWEKNEEALRQVAEETLINQGGQAGVETNTSLWGLTLP